MLGSDGGMSDSSSAVSAVSTPLSVDRENTKKGPVDELRSSVLGEDGSETAETAEDLASSQVRTPVSPSATPDPKLPRTKNRTDPHMTTTYRASGIKWTPAPDPSQSPVAAVLEHAVPTVPRPYATCPVCEGDLTPVPPHDLWSACRSCHPGTFTRV